MLFTCSSCPKTFDYQEDLDNHFPSCQAKTSCSVTLPCGIFVAYKNTENKWICHCSLSKCSRQYPTYKSIQTHLRRYAKEDTTWNVRIYDDISQLYH